jgi:hypothetical protein
MGATTRFAISRVVATGYAVSPPNSRISPRGATKMLARPVGIGQLVFGEEQARDGAAHRGVVPRVGDEVDENVAPSASSRLEAFGIAAELARDCGEELARIVRRHPVARVDVFGRDGGRDEMLEVPPERRDPEPDDAARLFLAAREARTKLVRAGAGLTGPPRGRSGPAPSPMLGRRKGPSTSSASVWMRRGSRRPAARSSPSRRGGERDPEFSIGGRSFTSSPSSSSKSPMFDRA